MPQTEDSVKITIPPKGRIGAGSLCYLVDKGILPSDFTAYSQFIKRTEENKSRVMGSQYDMQSQLMELWNKGYRALGILSDRERPERPARLGFFRYDTQVDGIKVVVEGEDHYTAPQLIKSHQADIIFAGWDEIFGATVNDMMHPQSWVRKWNTFNEAIDDWNTDLRISGSAFLKDYVMHSIVTSEQRKGVIRPNNLRGLTVYVNPVYVGIYQRILNSYKDDPINFKSVDHVEKAVARDPSSIGIAIVETGKDIIKNDLYISGKPVLQSETVIGFNHERFNESEAVRKILEKMQPLKYSSEERLKSHDEWYNQLVKNVGDRWIDRPELFKLVYDEDLDRTFVECFI